MNLELPNAKQSWGDGLTSGTKTICLDCLFEALRPRFDNTTSHLVDAYALRIGAALIVYFPETDEFAWYKHFEKIKANPAWIPLKGIVPRSLPRPNDIYLIQLFPRSAEWVEEGLARFGNKNILNAMALSLLLEIEEELWRKGGLSNGN